MPKYLWQNLRIKCVLVLDILIMIGFKDKTRTKKEICGLLKNKCPNTEPTS